MQNKKNIYIFVSIAIIVFVLGYFIGNFQAKSKLLPKIKSYQKVFNLVNSQTIANLVLKGRIEKISGKTLTISYKNTNLNIPVGEKTKIIMLHFPLFYFYQGVIIDPNEPPILIGKIIKFNELKINDLVNVYSSVKEDGSLETIQIIKFQRPNLQKTETK